MKNLDPICKAAGVGAALLLAVVAGPANAGLIVQDFNDLALNKVASFTIGRVTYTTFDGTISTTGAGNSDGYYITPNGTTGLISFNSMTHLYSPIIATIAGGTNFVSVDLSGYAAYLDTPFLSAYDLDGGFIGTVYDTTYDPHVDILTLSFSAPHIGSVAFGSTQRVSYIAFADNFTFANTVPEPASWAMLVIGFGMVGGALRRRAPAPQRAIA